MPITLVGIPGGATTSRKPLDEIDTDVKSAVEDALIYNADRPDERLEAEFPTQGEADDFLKDARAYAYQREAGRLVVSGNSTKEKTITEGSGKNKTSRTVSFARFRVAEYAGDADAPEGESGE